MKFRFTLLCFIALLTGYAVSAQSHTQYYVSNSGNDTTGTGTLANPWRTISFAVNSAGYNWSTSPPTLVDSNITIYVRGGTYAQPRAIYIGSNRGTNGKWLTIRPYQNEFVAIEGKNLFEKYACIFVIDGAKYIRIQGFDIRKVENDSTLTSGGLKDVRYGIAITGAAAHIDIVENDIYDIKWTKDTNKAKNPQPNDVVSAITVLGNTNTAMHHINIKDNTIHDIVPGYAEAVAINGNIDTFEVRGNEVYDVANIGIVSAGNYRWVLANNPGLNPALNQSRNGRITNNTVYRCISPVAISAGIYLDGSKNIRVDSNDCYRNGVGISVGNEQDSSAATGHLVHDNMLYENLGAGIFIGSNNPSSIVENSTIKWNTIIHNYRIDPVLRARAQNRYGPADSSGMWAEVVFNRARTITFEENEITSGSDIVSAFVYGQTNLTLRYNEYFTRYNNPCNATFILDTNGDGIGDVFPGTFHQYVQITGYDATSKLGGVAYNPNGCGTTLARRATVLQKVSVFPNPASSELKVIVRQDKAGLVNVGLWDVTGKLVLAQQKRVDAGVQMMGWTELNLKPGVYFLRVNAETVKVVIR